MDWIDATLRRYQAQERLVSSFNFPRLSNHYSDTRLSNVNAIVVNERIPLPPLTQLGIRGLSAFEKIEMVGPTYKNSDFIHSDSQSESVHFHELIHTVQWDTLGPENFLLAYGVLLALYEYRATPFEGIAYGLQGSFESKFLEGNVEKLVEHHTKKVWNEVEKYL